MQPNIHLLTETQRAILARPATLNFEDFETDIAGFACQAAGRDLRTVDAFSEARKLLRVSTAQLLALCMPSRWPRRFQRRFDPEPTNRRTLKRNAHLAAARIEHFVATGQ
jgi:hypothetical protein